MGSSNTNSKPTSLKHQHPSTKDSKSSGKSGHSSSSTSSHKSSTKSSSKASATGSSSKPSATKTSSSKSRSSTEDSKSISHTSSGKDGKAESSSSKSNSTSTGKHESSSSTVTQSSNHGSKEASNSGTATKTSSSSDSKGSQTSESGNGHGHHHSSTVTSGASSSTITSAPIISSTDHHGGLLPWLASVIDTVEGGIEGGISSLGDGLLGGAGHQPKQTSSSDVASSTEDSHHGGLSFPFDLPLLGNHESTSSQTAQPTSTDSPGWPWDGLLDPFGLHSTSTSSSSTASPTLSKGSNKEGGDFDQADHFASTSSHRLSSTATPIATLSSVSKSSSDIPRTISDAEEHLSKLLAFGSGVLATGSTSSTKEASPTGGSNGSGGDSGEHGDHSDSDNSSHPTDDAASPKGHHTSTGLSNSSEGFAISTRHPGSIAGLTLGAIGAVVVLPLLLFIFWWLPKRRRRSKSYHQGISANHTNYASTGFSAPSGGRWQGLNGGNVSSNGHSSNGGGLKKLQAVFKSLTGGRKTGNSTGSHESWGDRSLSDEGSEWGHRWASQSNGRLSPEEITSEQVILPASISQRTKNKGTSLQAPTRQQSSSQRGWHSHSQSVDLAETSPLTPTVSNPESVEELIEPFADPEVKPRGRPTRF